MARKSTGSVVVKDTSRGKSFALRFRAYGKRHFVHLGYAQEWTRERAEEELAFVLASARRGEWEAHREPEPPREVPTFHVFASRWLAEREGELRPATVAAYRWALVDHLLPHFHGMRVDSIGVGEVDTYRRLKVRENRLSAASVNQTISRLGQVLDAAEERGLTARNPVRVNPRNRKLKAGKPKRAWLEPWQVLALLDSAGELDREDRRGLPVRRPLLAALAWAGLRIGEAAALRWRDVDLAAGRLTVSESKTDAGVREVDLQPELREELVAWRAVTPYAGRDDRVFPTRTGGALNRHNVRQRVVLRAVERANERLAAAGREPLPEGLSSHALRRSFISWLVHEGEDVAYVSEQAGHTDPSMTLGVYARAVRTGRLTARSRRRLEGLRVALTGTGDDERTPEPSPTP